MTEVDLASVQGLALGFWIGVTLLYIARRRPDGRTRAVNDLRMLEEHVQLTTEVAVGKSKVSQLSNEIVELNALLESSRGVARDLRRELDEVKGSRRWVCPVCNSTH